MDASIAPRPPTAATSYEPEPNGDYFWPLAFLASLVGNRLSNLNFENV
jgi:hypothetical protein